jgi:hypothetical protein
MASHAPVQNSEPFLNFITQPINPNAAADSQGNLFLNAHA